MRSITVLVGPKNKRTELLGSTLREARKQGEQSAMKEVVVVPPVVVAVVVVVVVPIVAVAGVVIVVGIMRALVK